MTDKAPRGRFAPSPTGPLHFGSLIAAVGSYLSVKSRQGQWLVRIEDLDPPREQAGAADNILKTLEAFKLEWDEPVVYQSRRGELYEEAISRLAIENLTYFCQCSRKEIASDSEPGVDGPRYPGTCRDLKLGAPNNSLRIIVPNEIVTFDDRIQGINNQNLAQEVGDFVIRRRDGLYSYQLAVVVDDAQQNITEVCRGTDLLDSTPRQRYLQSVLDLPTPQYAHLPIATNAAGQKLSKQTMAEAVMTGDQSSMLSKALYFLGQKLPGELERAPTAEIIQWGVNYWDEAAVPKVPAIHV